MPASLHSTLLQHWMSGPQACPNSAHTSSPGGGSSEGVPQVPLLCPEGISQINPEQQSEVVEQSPPSGTQAPPHTKPPSGFGTHGSPQQSALEAHSLPARALGSVQSGPPTAMVQRGIPKASG